MLVLIKTLLYHVFSDMLRVKILKLIRNQQKHYKALIKTVKCSFSNHRNSEILIVRFNTI